MKLSKIWILGAVIIGSLAGMAQSSPAQAYEWHRGHWYYTHHEGRLGWWWNVGPTWHYYVRPYPVIVAPQPSVTVIQAAPPVVGVTTVAVEPSLFYCKATGTYYPDTMSCPGGWMKQVGGVPPSPTP